MKNNNLIAINGKINSGKDTIGNIIQIITALPHITDTGVKSFLGREIYSPYQIKKFADKLKDIVCILLGCTREQLEDREFKERELGVEWRLFKHNITGKIISPREMSIQHALHHGVRDSHYIQIDLTPRLMLQLLGTECGREILHPNIWVNSLMVDYKQIIGYASGDYFSTCGNCKKQFMGNKRAIRCEECSIFYPSWIITDMRFENELEAIKQRNGITIRVERDNEQVLKDKGIHIPQHLIKPEHESETALDSYHDWDYVIDNNSDILTLIKKVREILNKENII